MALELSRQRARESVLNRFRYVKTCVLARELCLLARTNRALLDAGDVRDCCAHISKLCSEAGCGEASALCARAAEAVTESEEEYLNLCEQSCQKCGESRRPSRRPTPPEGTVYVA